MNTEQYPSPSPQYYGYIVPPPIKLHRAHSVLSAYRVFHVLQLFALVEYLHNEVIFSGNGVIHKPM